MGSNLIGAFQQAVNLYNPIGVEGDFASRNPRATALTPNGGAFVAGPNGVIIGNFAWVASDGKTVNSYATGAVAPSGYVHRDQQGLLTEYLQAAGMLIPPGFPVTLMVAGDFIDLIAGGSAATVGASCYARYTDGALFIGSAPTGASGTGSIGSTFTATGTGTSLAVTSVTGLISIGDTIAGTGVPSGTTILAQVSGFNPRAPCGARPRRLPMMDQTYAFQSTRPVWGATGP
ncbi:MAG: structural cement protein Gp24 [Terracidiphilus sp.]